MAKGDSSTKNKKSSTYKPYDADNSLVRRVTSRVSQLLPQPSSWLSRFLTPRTSDSQHVESNKSEEGLPPPSKRMRTTYTSTEYIHQNNTVSLDKHGAKDSGRGEEISPIRSVGTSTRQDLAVAGPSGSQQVPQFILSPSLFPTGESTPLITKINGDDLSDSESASCSSLHTLTEKQQPSLFNSLNPPHQIHQNKNTSINLGQREYPSGSKQLKLDLSSSLMSNKRKISFDTAVFNSPFKGRLCGSMLSPSLLISSRPDESSFYSGNTTFGGASSSSDSLLRTRVLHSEIPVIVKPTEPSRPSSNNLASSTNKILKALEQFSSPVMEAKKMTLREGSLKRKAPAPYRELVIPTMPNLLRIKRRDRDLRRVRRPPPEDSGAVAAAASSASLSSTMATPTYSTQTLPLRLEKVEEAGGVTSSNWTKRSDEPQLPVLSFTSLPKFDPGIVKSASQLPIVPPSSKPKLEPHKQNEKSLPTSTCVYKFAKPITVADNSYSITSIPPSKKFSQPLSPSAEVRNPKCTEQTILSNCLTKSPNSDHVMTYVPPSEMKLKRKDSYKVNACETVTVSLKSGKVKPCNQKWECSSCYVSNDISKTKCIACESPKDKVEVLPQSGFGDQFKLKSNEWECSKCLVKNNVSESICVSCNQAKKSANKKESISKGFGDKWKPAANSWECKQCLVNNKESDSACIACTAARYGETSAPPLSSLFKKPEGSWECNSCLIQNKSDASACLACNTPRPGAQSKANFSFGMPQPDSKTEQFSFGVTDSKPTFTFGVPASSNSMPTTTFKFSSCPTEENNPKSTFTFGVANSEANPSEKKISTPLFSNVNRNSASDDSEKVSKATIETKKPSESSEVKPTFSFGDAIPKSSTNESTVNYPFNSKSVFGSVTSTSSGNNAGVTSSLQPTVNTSVNPISSASSTVSDSQISSVANPIFTFGTNETHSCPKGNGIVPDKAKPEETLFKESTNKDNKSLFGSSVKSVLSSVSSNKTESLFSKTDLNKQNVFSFESGTSDKKINSNSVEPKSVGFMFNPQKGDEMKNAVNPQNDEHSKVLFSSDNFSSPQGGFSFSSGTKPPEKETSLNANTFNCVPILSGGFSFKRAEAPPQPCGFGFPQKESAEATNTFSFGAAATNHSNNFEPTAGQIGTTDGFGTNQQSMIRPQPFGTVFGSAGHQQIQPTSFTFGASQSSERVPTAPFSFHPPQNVNNPPNNMVNSASTNFSFGQSSQNTSNVQAPAFDPNAKPVFKFTGGQTPTFSATSAPGSEVNKRPDRKIRRAVRRTTQK